MPSVLSTSNEFDRLDRAEDPEAFWEELEKIVNVQGIDFYIYLWRHRDGSLFHQTNLPSTAYGGAERDPFLKYCCANMGETFVGSGFDGRYPFLTDEEQEFVNLADTGGWCAGLAIPVSLRRHAACGGFNFGSRLPAKKFTELVSDKIDWFRSLALFAHQRIEQMGFSRPPSDPYDRRIDSLTPRQRTVFDLMQQGDGRQEIAKRMGISTLTVATHQKAVYRKLDIHSLREVMRLAPPASKVPRERG